jgi:NAD(P)-dependent dehydrogenase (short-subunit alcohol dehydrogenase family)
MKINQLRAVITGGAMGIGLATVKRLAAEGCKVSIWDLNQDALESARKQLQQYEGSM